MAVTLRALYAALEEKMPRSLSCEWDNDGIMCVKNLDREVKKVFCTLDVTERTIDEAEELGCDCILSHHPLIFHKLAGLDGDRAEGKRLMELLGRDIAVFSFHTRLDAAAGGVNDTLCETLHIRTVGNLEVDGKPIGRIAEPENETDFSTLIREVRGALGSPVVHCVSAKRPINRIAVLGGSGKDEWRAALAAGADTYITGTMDYNGFLDAKAAGLNVIAAGHFYTENPVVGRLAQWVTELFPEVVTVTSEVPCEVLTV